MQGTRCPACRLPLCHAAGLSASPGRPAPARSGIRARGPTTVWPTSFLSLDLLPCSNHSPNSLQHLYSTSYARTPSRSSCCTSATRQPATHLSPLLPARLERISSRDITVPASRTKRYRVSCTSPSYNTLHRLASPLLPEVLPRQPAAPPLAASRFALPIAVSDL